MNVIKLFSLVLALCLPINALADHGVDYWEKSVEFYKKDVKPWIYDDVIINAIKAQNKKYETFSASDVINLDNQWRGELSGKIGNKVLIGTMINKDISKHLRNKVIEADGFITEIILMDNKGLNVGVSDITSDYWQGDEDKWKRTFLTGLEQIYISETYFDESSRQLQNQFSVTISDQGQAIGAITIGINAQRFHEIQKAQPH